MTLKDLLFLFLERWPILLLTTILGGGLAVFYGRTVTPVYQVDALVQVDSKDGSKSGANPLGQLADIFEVANPTETEIELIRSRMVLGQVVEKRHLDVMVASLDRNWLNKLRKVPAPFLEVTRLDILPAYRSKPLELVLGDSGNYTLRFGKESLIVHGHLGDSLPNNPWHIGLFARKADSAVPGNRFLLTRFDPLDAIESLRKSLTIAEVGKKTGIIGLTLTGTDPVQAARTLNNIATTYVRQNVERKSEDAEKTLEFLNEQLPDLKRQLEASEQRLNEYRSRMGSIDLDVQAQQALEQQVSVQQKLVDLEQQRKEAAKLFRPDHPNVRTLDSIGTLYRAEASQQDKALRSLPLRQQQIVRLMRDVQVNTQLYTGLLNNAQQLRVVKAGEIGTVRIVDSAMASKVPIKPKKKQIAGIGLVAGFLLGAGILLLLRQLQNGVADPKVLERALGLTVYASIPHSRSQAKLRAKITGKQEGIHLLAVTDPADLAVESFRSLRTTLRFSMLDAPNHTLLFAGPSPNIGKSFVAINFASVLAQADFRVVLVDADMRRGLLHQYLGQERGMGLSDILSGTETVDSALRESGIPNFQFLSTGTIPPNPSELLLHDRFAQLLKTLEGRCDYVLVDCAPVLAVTDAVIVGKLAGTTLMVLKHGKHPLTEIEACHQRLLHAGVTVKGVVFDNVMSSGAAYGSRYGTAAYRYSYSMRK
jgi:tyrosine-protein kinase Etk/Wzc